MTAREIATYVKVSRSMIGRRARKEGWPFTAKHSRGGETYDFDVLKLPTDIRARIKASEVIRDKTLDWIERLTEGPWLDRACWAAIGMAIMYFGPVCIRILAR